MRGVQYILGGGRGHEAAVTPSRREHPYYMMSATLRLTAAIRSRQRSQSGLTLSQFAMSLGVIAMGLAIAYFLGTTLGENFNEVVAPAFDWM